MTSSVIGSKGLPLVRWLDRDRMVGLLWYLPAIIVLLLFLVGPLVAPYSPVDIVGSPNQPPGGAFPFGTDGSGMDILSRTLASFQYDILIGLAVTVLSTGLGIALGIAIGMHEAKRGVIGWLARTLARALDLFEALPAIVFSLAIVAFFGANIVVLIVCIGLALLPIQARVVRSEVLRVRGEAFIEAARMSGYSEARILLRNVLPNVSWPALANTTLMFGSSIFLVSALGFLGVGLRPPTPEWGSMISIAASGAATGRWWPALFPALALALSVVAFSLAGHRLFRSRHR